MSTCTKQEVPYQLLTPKGLLTDEGRGFWQTVCESKKIDLYKWMKLARLFDRRSVVLQRQGRIGTYAPLEGQEASQVGSATALEPIDWVFPSYREHGVAMLKGMPLFRIFLYWMGRVEGCEPPDSVRLLPPYVPIATQIPHAVGAAWAAKLRKQTDISIAYFGDGASSEGDFHEACNFAGVFCLPIVFFCQNNGYAISVPFSRQSATRTIAEKSKAYGFEGVRVDGNDVLAVYKVMLHAAQKARTGGGPTLVEALTYRMASHTTADNARVYRAEEEESRWAREDPLIRYEHLLRSENLWNDDFEDAWQEECNKKIEEAIQTAEAAPVPGAAHMFRHVFQDLPSSLKQQVIEGGGE